MSIKLPKLFLDSGNPEDTKKVKSLIGYIDGQTTNPSLVVKNPTVLNYIAQGKKLQKDELISIYREIITEIDKMVSGPISVETYADWNTPAQEMVEQAHEMKSWGHNIYIKFPTIKQGLIAANEFVKSGGNVNMTLVFDQNQAAAVYTATYPAFATAFVSPFIGRWDDKGYDGLDLIRNIKKMYRNFSEKRREKECHVEILAASIRNMEHFYASMQIGADIITAPLSIYEEWINQERFVPDEKYHADKKGLKSIFYQDTPLHNDFTQYEIRKEDNSLLSEGLDKFVSDWNKILS
jgi:transaldolase